MNQFSVVVKENIKIADNIYLMEIQLPEKITDITCGQFLNISTGSKEQLLKRPFGILKVDNDIITFCYQIKGEGTVNLSNIKKGESLNCVLPLGNGFKNLENARNICLIGGGVGIFPLISVILEYNAKKIEENNKNVIDCDKKIADNNKNVIDCDKKIADNNKNAIDCDKKIEENKDFTAFFGFRNKECICLEKYFKDIKNLQIVTDDGSYGKKGNAVSAFINYGNFSNYDVILACGPLVMLKALKNCLVENDIKIKTYVSLEERMGCGIGACLVCTCKKSDGEKNVRVCKDGPVFDIWEVLL